LAQGTDPAPSIAGDLKSIQQNNSGKFSNLKTQTEAKDYFGFEYTYKNKNYVQRTAKITPKKMGLFVTLWKRGSDGHSQPYDKSDHYDFVVIICKSKKLNGMFLFPKKILLKRKILSNKNKSIDGKRGFRLYPPWDTPRSKQVLSTQKWQLEFFFTSLCL